MDKARAPMAHVASIRLRGALKPTANGLGLAVSGLGMFVTPIQMMQIQLFYPGWIYAARGRRARGVMGWTLVDRLRQQSSFHTKIKCGRPTTIVNGSQYIPSRRHRSGYGTSGKQECSSLEIVQVERYTGQISNVAGLKSIGGGSLSPTEKSGLPAFGIAGTENFGDIQSGNLEMSNINMTDELTKMMQAQQAYSASSRLLQAAVDMSKRLIS